MVVGLDEVVGGDAVHHFPVAEGDEVELLAYSHLQVLLCVDIQEDVSYIVSAVGGHVVVNPQRALGVHVSVGDVDGGVVRVEDAALRKFAGLHDAVVVVHARGDGVEVGARLRAVRGNLDERHEMGGLASYKHCGADRCGDRGHVSHRNGHRGCGIEGDRAVFETGGETFRHARCRRHVVEEIGAAVQRKNGFAACCLAVTHNHSLLYTCLANDLVINGVVSAICPAAVGGIRRYGVHNQFQCFVAYSNLQRAVDGSAVGVVRCEDIGAGRGCEVVHFVGRRAHFNRRPGCLFCQRHRGADGIHRDLHVACHGS